MIENKRWQLKLGDRGYVSRLLVKDDPYQMNWVIEDQYLRQTGYQDCGRFFGEFDLNVDGKAVKSLDFKPSIEEKEQKVLVTHEFEQVRVSMEYDLGRNEDQLFWKVYLENKTEQTLAVSEFGIWASLAYVMFRDKNVLRNIHNSAAVFPYISGDYTKVNGVRRDNQGGNLGLYQTEGRTISVGTYCDYVNLFFENVSPSLDGMLFHKLILAGGYPEGFENYDWIYEKDGFTLDPEQQMVWEYAVCTNESQEDFLEQGMRFGHPKIQYTPLNVIHEMVRVSAEVPGGKTVVQAKVYYKEEKELKEMTVPAENANGRYQIAFKPVAFGEHKVVLQFSDGTEDFVVLNVMDDLAKVMEERADYICRELYNGPKGSIPYAFEPVSNQGESLGKLNFVLKKNLMGTLDSGQVRKVEASAVYYVKQKWFIDGDFRKPRKLYGNFYRCMDFEYIGHLFYLLSEFDERVLVLNSSETYLSWAAEVFDLRVNPDLHEEERGKEEAQMLGVYFLYLNTLMEKLKTNGQTEKYQIIRSLWEKMMKRIDAESSSYKAAITEHFYDNAGFGPTAGALAESGMLEGAKRYGQLLLANIGTSNDFRAQNPDRWWEALTYMIHSLWGGVTAAAAFKVYEGVEDLEYLKASYRATAGILYCYDTHTTAAKPLQKGMAASTYAVAGPHINRPDLSRERFGQAAFFRDGGIFARLFENDDQTPDWDMGEEIVAYLDSFGKKTFVKKDGDSIQVINGSYEEYEEGYIVTSFAPYSEEFYYVSENKMTLMEKSRGLRRIYVSKNSLTERR